MYPHRKGLQRLRLHRKRLKRLRLRLRLRLCLHFLVFSSLLPRLSMKSQILGRYGYSLKMAPRGPQETRVQGPQLFLFLLRFL